MSNHRKARRSRLAIRRSWPASIIWAIVVVGLMFTFAVVVNSFISNRAIHWDWAAAMMVLGSAGDARARRQDIF
ncbi:MAG TPA: hypothetical protein QGI07_03470 [Dehalococcoidia bacterium]|nr:hypothetical protein [Dehalococcoidia bacterium]